MRDSYYDLDLIDEILDALESEYGVEVERIAKVNEQRGLIHMTIIFKDYRLLEAEIEVCQFCDIPSIRIRGNYF